MPPPSPDGRAIALKVDDGGQRARSPVMVAALRRLGVDVSGLDDVRDGAAVRWWPARGRDPLGDLTMTSRTTTRPCSPVDRGSPCAEPTENVARSCWCTVSPPTRAHGTALPLASRRPGMRSWPSTNAATATRSSAPTVTRRRSAPTTSPSSSSCSASRVTGRRWSRASRGAATSWSTWRPGMAASRRLALVDGGWIQLSRQLRDLRRLLGRFGTAVVRERRAPTS